MSDPKRTLSGWLRDARGAPKKDDSSSELEDSNRVVQPATPSASKKPDSAPRVDLLAGLSNLDEEEETPDWLKNLQNSLPVSSQEESAPIPEQQSVSDLFSGLLEPQEQPVLPEKESGLSGEPAVFLFDENYEPAPQAEKVTPDWLSALAAQDEANKSTAALSEQSVPETGKDQSIYADLPDWLASLTGESGEPVLPKPEFRELPSEQQPNTKDDTSDWLSGLGGDFNTEESFVPAEPVFQAKAETPDWLARMGEDAAASITGSDVKELSLPAVESTVETPSTPQSADLPDWLISLQGSVSTPPNSSEVKESAAPVASSTLDVPIAPQTDDLPDWLASLQGSAPPLAQSSGVNEPVGSAATSTPEFPSAPQSDDLPDWLASLQGSAPPLAQNSGMEETVASAATSTPETTEVASILPSDGMPDWMAEIVNVKPVEQPASLPKSFDNDSMDEFAPLNTNSELASVDWITSIEVIPQTDEKPDQALVPLPVTTGADEASFTEDAPDWLNAFAAEAGVVDSQIQAQGETDLVLPVQAMPASTSRFAQQIEPGSDSAKVSQAEVELPIPVPLAEQNIEAILSMDTPDWLSGFIPDKMEPSAASTGDNQLGDDLPTAELPSWVQAMRPMESVMVENNDSGDEQEIEKLGPLAGLHSILPSQPDQFAKQNIEAQPPKVYLTKLLVSETQQAQAALLENLLNSENNTSHSFLKRPEMVINRPLRWLIAAVLLIAILIPTVFGSNIFPVPVIPAESAPIGMFIKTMTDLPDGASVLVVVDYQPGFVGEMEAVTGPVIEQLMMKKSRLAFVSTSPLGGLMAERLLQKFANIYPYQVGMQYVNLGYLPGGAGGIKIFAEQPRATLGQDTLLGDMWDTPVLSDVTINKETRLSNFAAVIVATDNPDTGRLWIEQAQPLLRSKPMLMVVSAQAEPMLRPYFISNQLKGLVAGLEGGTLYESAQGKSGQARTYWDAFGVGIMVTELLIIFGGFWSLISGLRARRIAMEQNEADL